MTANESGRATVPAPAARRVDLLRASVREIAADFLGPDVVLNCAARTLADPERLRVYIGSHSRGASGPGYMIHTEKGGCGWSNENGSGLIDWARLWHYATAGATSQLVNAATDSYREYVGAATETPHDGDRYDAAVDANAAAAWAIVAAAPDPAEQLELFAAIA